MIKVEIPNSEVKVKNGVSAKTGRPYAIREQEGWAYFFDRQGRPNPHPTKVRLNLEDDQQPYAVGIYELAPSSFYADKFSNFGIRAALVPKNANASTLKAA